MRRGSTWLDLESLLASETIDAEALEAWARVGGASQVEQLPRIMWIEEKRLLEALDGLEPSVVGRFFRLIRFPAVVDLWRSTLRRLRETTDFTYPQAVARPVEGSSPELRVEADLRTLEFDSAEETRSIFQRSRHGWIVWTPGSLFAHLPSTVDLLIQLATRTDARHRLQSVGIALYRYHLREGRFPDALVELVPAFLSAVPTDPYDGEPLRYRVEEGGCVVYSVGPDRRDGGGRVDRESDLVFRCSSVAVDSSEDGPSGQFVTSASIVDHDYRFRLDSPGWGWRLMGEAEIRKTSPDGLAGAASGGVRGVVIVEEAPAPELKACVKMLLDAMVGEDGEVPVLEDVRFQKRPAVRFVVTTRTQGVRLRIETIAFMRRAFLYQIVNRGPEGSTDEDGFSFRPFLSSFHLLEGDVTPRLTRIDVPDRVDVGREVKDGALRSAVAPSSSFCGDLRATSGHLPARSTRRSGGSPFLAMGSPRSS